MTKIQDYPGTLAQAFQSPEIKAGDRMFLHGGMYAGDFEVRLSGESERIITVAPYSPESPVVDGSIFCLSNYTIFSGLEIYDSDFFNRTSEETGSHPIDITSVDGARGIAAGIEFRDCVIHDTRQGAYCPDEATVIFDGCVIFFNGWLAPDRGHGHGIYAQKNTIVRNCIIFNNFGWGIHIYGEGDQSLDNVTLEDNISFCNGVLSGRANPNFLHGRSGTVLNPMWRRNYSYHKADMTRGNSFGYVGTFTGGVMVDNYLPEGCGISVTGQFAENSGNVFAPESVNKVVVIPVRDRAHVAIYNWQQLDNVTVTVPSVFSAGASVNARNVQDYFDDIQQLTVAGNGTIIVNMQAANRTVGTPTGWTAPATTFPQFGAFVLERTD